MHRRYRMAGKQEAKLENDAQIERNAEKNRSDNRISKIAALDGDTMVEAFKYLNYCQLAINSRVSKRFRDVIQINRHSLARLYVYDIGMVSRPVSRVATKIFNKVLPPEAYNEWVIRNGYTKQAPLEDQVDSSKSTQNILNVWELYAYAFYKDPASREWNDRTLVFSASAQLSHENWPLFQHFVRLVTDPFIYINRVQLTYQNDVLNLLAGAISADRSRLECKEMFFNLRGNIHKSFAWAKSHIRCNLFDIDGETGAASADIFDEVFADFYLTAAQCTQSVKISSRHYRSQIWINFVQKFLDLKNCDECHIVESVRCICLVHGTMDALKRNFADFAEKEEKGKYDTVHIFEFVNDHIGKKLQLTTLGCSLLLNMCSK